MTDENDKNKVTVGLSANSFPLANFIEWDKDCKQFFGDVRWLKIWNDHLMAKQTLLNAELLDLIFQKIKKIEEQISIPKDEEEIKTIGE